MPMREEGARDVNDTLISGDERPRPRQLGRRTRLLRVISRYGIVLLFVAVLILFSALPQSSATFASVANVQSLINGQAVVMMIAVAMVIPLLSGNIDLTVGATAGLTAVVIATCVTRYQFNLVLAVSVGLVCAIAVGLVNGFLIARVTADSFVITFGMQTLIAGGLIWYTNSLPVVSNYPAAFVDFGDRTWFGVPRLTLVLVVVIAFAVIIQDRTPYGRHLQAIGSNARAARLVGIPVQRAIFLSFVISAFTAGLAGVVLTARSGGAVPSAGPSFLFPAFAAVFLGMTMIRPGKPNIVGTVVAVAFVSASVSGFTMLGASAWVQDVFNGAALVIAITVATLFARRQGARRT